MSAPSAITASTFPAEARRTASGSSKERAPFPRVKSFPCPPAAAPRGHAPGVPLESEDFARVGRQQPDFPDTEVHEDLGAHPVIAQVRLESEALVRLDRVEPPVPQPGGADLVLQPASPAFLPHVEEN